MPTPPISGRARRILDHNPVPDYITERLQRMDRAWTADDQSGYIDLSTAENKLMWDVIGPRMAEARDVPPSVLAYDVGVGNLGFRDRIAEFLQSVHGGRRHDPANVYVLAGAAAVLESVFYAICDPGDGVLVPTPSYAGFWIDLESRVEASIIPVHTSADEGFRLTTDHLERAMSEAERPVKALLFTSPNNPLGTVSPRREIVGLIDWARERGIHVVFDELYALSVFHGPPFVSAASIGPSLPDHVHVVWAFSKDFAASGLRCGVLVSENEELLASVRSQSPGSGCSGDTQYLLSELIGDHEWTARYVAEMRRRLANSHDLAVAALDGAGIAHVGGGAGHFFLVDLRRFLETATWHDERRLWRAILDSCDVNLTPGAALRSREPGFFRLCFAWVPLEAVEQGIGRVAALLSG